MSKKISIRIKAVFLAVVFGLNPVIGFACSIGIDMGFNSSHHVRDKGVEAVLHIHEDGKEHVHYEKKHTHKQEYNHSVDKKKYSEKENQDCCTDQVKKFEDVDKSLPLFFKLIHPAFLNLFFDVYCKTGLPANDRARNIKQFVRSYHPPIPDIRITIQSFQI